MKALQFIDSSGITYTTILTWEHDEFTNQRYLGVHSCWRFYPGRTSGEPIPSSQLPWHGRQVLAELLNNSMP